MLNAFNLYVNYYSTANNSGAGIIEGLQMDRYPLATLYHTYFNNIENSGYLKTHTMSKTTCLYSKLRDIVFEVERRHSGSGLFKIEAG